MNKIIQQWKDTHRQLIHLLEEVKKGPGITGTAWRDHLFEAKKIFLEHVHEEDALLYPALEKALTKLPDDLKKMREMSLEMKEITVKVEDFFNTYQAVSFNTEFIQDFAELKILLSHRITREEDWLYPLYVKMLPGN